MSKLFTVLAMLLMSTMSYGRESSRTEYLKINASRVAVIDGVISGDNLHLIENYWMDMSKKDLQSGPLDLVISSPGGSVTTGFKFIDVLEATRARGGYIRCFVPTMAASMAFQIFLHCDERYALDRSLLLWHRARVFLGGLFSTPMTGPAAAVLAQDLLKMDSLIWREVLDNVTGMPKAQLSYHFENETMHISELLAKETEGFLTSYGSIDGLLEALRNQSVPRTERQSMFSFGGDTAVPISPEQYPDLFRQGEIVYIYTGSEIK